MRPGTGSVCAGAEALAPARSRPAPISARRETEALAPAALTEREIRPPHGAGRVRIVDTLFTGPHINIHGERFARRTARERAGRRRQRASAGCRREGGSQKGTEPVRGGGGWGGGLRALEGGWEGEEGGAGVAGFHKQSMHFLKVLSEFFFIL